ncbi:MAG TPA: hypothetical protein VL335_00935 [Candidatus Paceibacterota bacterium]|jgi:hypothetical protein|nr:hypothetical protein [Candidatus Paceibacterota bacterium]
MKLKLTVIAALIIIGMSVHHVFGQSISFDQTTANIRTFENQRYYTSTTTGPLLSIIIIGLVQNNTTILGNKHDLVTTVPKKS